MEDEIDFDDLLGEEKRYVPPPPEPASQPSVPVVTNPTSANLPDLASAPTERELSLAQQVSDLQKDRDELKAEVLRLRTRLPVPELSTVTAVPAESITGPAPSTSSTSHPAITIPHDILPVLAILRKHIAELTRDNAALRYVFLGGPLPNPRSGVRHFQAEASSMTSGNSTETVAPGEGDIPEGTDKVSLERIEISGAQGVNLEQVVARVKELVRENEELGELVMTLGQASPDVWQQALDDSRAVIESLDSDLSQHLATIESLRLQLEDARRSKPPPKGPSHASTSATTAQQLNDAPRGPSAGHGVPQGPASSGAGGRLNGSHRSSTTRPVHNTQGAQGRVIPLVRPHHSSRPSNTAGSGAGPAAEAAGATTNGRSTTSSVREPGMGIGILGAANATANITAKSQNPNRTEPSTLGLPERDKRRERDRDSQSSGFSGGGGGSTAAGNGGSGRRDERGGHGRSREGRDGRDGSKDPPRGPRDDRDYKRRR